MNANVAHSPSLITRLNREWKDRADLVHNFPHGTMTGQQTLELVTNRAEGSEEILRGLFAAAGDGDEVCLRVSLQIVLPAVVNVAKQCVYRQSSFAGSYEEPLAVTVALSIERIKKAPLHRPGSVLGNFALDLLKLSLRSFEMDQREVLTFDGQCPAEQGRSELHLRLNGDGGSETERSTQQLLSLAAWARDHDVLTETETSIFVCYTIGSSEERAALAARVGSTRDGMHMRAHRIRQQLKKAVTHYALQRTDLMAPAAGA